MKTIKILTTAVILLASLSAFSQTPQGDLNRQLEVTRAYEPTVGQATKLDIKPNMVDTVALRPEVKVSFTPNPIAYSFGISPINAAKVNLRAFNTPKSLYVKAGIGAPFQSLLDVYATPIESRSGFIGVKLNHYGSWSKLTNDNDFKAPASITFNTVGLFGEHRFGRYSVGGDLFANLDMMHRYGFFTGGTELPESFDTSAAALRQNYTTVGGKVYFGNSFEDLSKFNFRVGAHGAYFADHFDNSETEMGVNLDLGKLFNDKHQVTLLTAFKTYQGGGNIKEYEDNMVTITPMYRLKTKRFSFGVGFDYIYHYNSDADNGVLIPRIDLKLDITRGYFVPYAEVSGRLINNGYRALSARNPYIIEGLVMPDTKELNARAGIMGSISSSFSYKAFVGYTHAEEMAMFANIYGTPNSHGNLFGGIYDSADIFVVGGNIEGRISGSFGVEAAVEYRAYSMGWLEHTSGVPSVTADITMKYNYRDKLFINFGGELCGDRYFSMINFGTMQVFEETNFVGATFDLRLYAKYKINRDFGVFIQGSNLLNQKLYQFSGYRGLGINALAGVEIQF